MSVTGGCFCGAIKYRVDGQLHDGRSCHCSRCRKAFNGPASAYALVNASQFQWLQGESLLSTYTSKEGFGLQFCCRCGSTLCGTYLGEVHGVTLGCVDGDPDVEIEMHIYTASKAGWERIPDDVIQYPEAAPQK